MGRHDLLLRVIIHDHSFFSQRNLDIYIYVRTKMRTNRNRRFILYAHLFVGNALVCFVIFKRKDMRSVTNLLLFNMALSDFISTVFFVPSALAVGISPYSWPLGDFMCRAPPVIATISLSVSIYSMVALAVERCACVMYLASSLMSRNSCNYRCMLNFD